MSAHRKAGRLSRRLGRSPHLITAAILTFVAVPAYFASSASAAAGAGDLTTFPAANITVDSGGANDINSDQVDMTQMGNDPGASPNPYRLFWSWAKTDWTGKNTGNACALLDADGDNKIDQAVCAIIGNGAGAPGATVIQVGTPVLHNCNDHFSDRCGTPSVVAGATILGGVVGSNPLDTTGNLITDTNPFPGPNFGDPNSSIEVQIDQTHLTAKALINVCSYPSNGNGGNNNPFDCIVNVGSSIQLTKTANPTVVNTGDSVTYTITAKNNGVSVLDQVTVTDTTFSATLTCKLNGAGSAVTMPYDGLDPGDTIVCTFNHTFLTIPATNPFTNDATTSAVDSIGGAVSAKASAQVTVNAAPTATVIVSKTVTGSPPAGLGKVDVNVTCNDGTNQTPALADGDSHNVTGITDGATCTVTETGKQSADSTTYTLDGNPYTEGANFTVSKNAASTVAVTNHYNGARINVSKTVTGSPPAGLGNFDIAVTCGGVTTTKHVADGGSDSLTGIAGGTSCSVTESGAQGADTTTYTKDAAAYTAGTNFSVVNNQTYNIVVTNDYNGGTIHVTKTVTGAPPAGLKDFDIDVTCGVATTHLHIAGGGSADVTGIPGGSNCSATEVGAQGATSTSYALDGAAYTAGTPFSVANSARHTVAVTNDYVAAPLPPVLTPNLTLTKSSVPTAGGTVQPGDSVTYTLAYANTGTGPAIGTLASDTLPADTTFVSASAGGSYNAATNTVSWAVGTVSAGASGTVSFVVKVANSATDGEVITNVGNVSAAGVAPIVSNPVTLTVAVPATPTPTLDLVKEVNKAAAEFGDTLTYTFTVLAGGVDQTGVEARDRIPDGTTYVPSSATCSTGCSASLSGGLLTWSIGNLAQGDSVELTYKVTIDTPDADADGGIPAVTIVNVGSIHSIELVDPVDSNAVKTDITAVLGLHNVRPPKVKPVHHDRLPFTGFEAIQMLVLATIALAVGSGLTVAARRRRTES